MNTMDLSLPQIIDLTTHQRQRAEKALAIAHRHLTAQEVKVKRLRTFINRLPELVTSGAEQDDKQLKKHRAAARKEYDEAVETMEKLHTMREKLQRKVKTKIEVERTMETIAVPTGADEYANTRTGDLDLHGEMRNVYPMDERPDRR